MNRRRFVVTCGAAGGLALARGSLATAGGQDKPMYVMAYFRTPAEALHLAVSDDGYRWRALNDNQPVLRAEVGNRSIRDPFIVAGHDGRFHLLSTNGWHAENILHAVSDDLLAWRDQALVPVMQGVAGVRNCWAPEAFWDEEAKLYRLIWSSTVNPAPGPAGYDHRIWSATTTDFHTYTPARLFFDPGYNVIDADIVRRPGGGYLMAFKDERGENRRETEHKDLWVAFADRGDGPWTMVPQPAAPKLAEGPTLYRVDRQWVMVCDRFMDGRFAAVASDDGRTWTDITARMTFPPGPRHACVFTVQGPVADRLQTQARRP